MDLCGCCYQPWDRDGVKGQALQCDLCDCWYHAMFEKFGSKQYKSFSSLAKFIPNVLYFCNHNKCLLRLKRIVAEFVRSSMDKSDKVLDLLQQLYKSVVSTLTAQIGKCIEDVGTKIENLLSSQSVLQEEVNSKSVKDFPVSLSTVDVEDNAVASHVSCTIVNKLAKRDKRKKNIVIYNLHVPEGKDREVGKLSVILIKTVYDLESQINRVVHLC